MPVYQVARIAFYPGFAKASANQPEKKRFQPRAIPAEMNRIVTLPAIVCMGPILGNMVHVTWSVAMFFQS